MVLRRVADPTDGLTEPTLHLALDGHIGGTVEVADSGPFRSTISGCRANLA